uniref:Uncharacterized protein n=1 Tax=Rhizophora mucronata TaxID=61149 RepID=A0A2P2Q260_RHIMU
MLLPFQIFFKMKDERLESR